MTISIPPVISKQINEYCSLNSIDNIEGFCVECLMKGFSIEKFGNSPLDKIKMENGEDTEKKEQEAVKSENIKKVRKVRVVKKTIKKND